MSMIFLLSKKPLMCAQCPCCFIDEEEAFCNAAEDDLNIQNPFYPHIPDDCPADWQKHGDLIDRNELYDLVEKKYKLSSGQEHVAYRKVLDMICDIDAVIEAEE